MCTHIYANAPRTCSKVKHFSKAQAQWSTAFVSSNLTANHHLKTNNLLILLAVVLWLPVITPGFANAN
jgi:hypothetical protein